MNDINFYATFFYGSACRAGNTGDYQQLVFDRGSHKSTNTSTILAIVFMDYMHA
jgi:hypothetical protein